MLVECCLAGQVIHGAEDVQGMLPPHSFLVCNVLCPRSSFGQARLGGQVHISNSIFASSCASFRLSEEAKAAYFGTYLPQQLGYIERLLEKNNEGKGYFVGDDFTIVRSRFRWGSCCRCVSQPAGGCESLRCLGSPSALQ